MSLPKFEVQGSLFESLEWAAADLFDDKDGSLWDRLNQALLVRG